jgi:hypothetical protein
MSSSQSDTKMFFQILVFFTLMTTVTGVINLSNAGYIDVGSLADPTGGSESFFQYGTVYSEGANTVPGNVITNLNFTSISAVNPNVTTLIGGPWTLVSGTGLRLTGTPFLAGVLNPSVVVARNVRISSGTIYYFSAKVDNSGSGGDFYVFPRFIDGYSGSDLKVVFSNDGIHIKKFPLYLGFFDNGDDYFFSFPGARNTIPGGSTIKTVLTEAVSSDLSNTPTYTSNLIVYKDGSQIFSTPVRSILPGTNINDQVRHGGAGSDTVGFVVAGFPDTNMTDTSASYYSGSQGTSSSWDPLDAIGQFAALVATIFGVSRDALIPVWLWSLVAVPCLGTLSYLGIRMLRGI